MAPSTPGGERWAADAPGSALQEPPDDVLIFERTDSGFRLVGGDGRGSSWAGIVDVSDAEAALVGTAWQSAALRRQDSSGGGHVVGPYYAAYSAAIPVGDRHVVPIGSSRPIEDPDSALIRFAADEVEASHGVPASKLIEDELELVHALRTLMEHRAETVPATLNHIAATAATALSCEIAFVRVTFEDLQIAAGYNAEPPGWGVDQTIEQNLASAARGTATINQGGATHQMLGRDVVSYMTLPIRSPSATGVLALGHGADRPRGFTSLCQRIGRALADAAEPLITQAKARETLSAERDLLALISRIDPLTGIANRRGWEERAALLVAGDGPFVLVSCDLDGLKRVNDGYGHQVGDALLRAAASLLTAAVRETDLVARVGGDEFAILLVGADPAVAALVGRRIRRAERRRVTEAGVGPRLSIGMATVVERDLEASQRTADDRMYANKRRRMRTAGRASPTDDRRRDRRSKRT